MANRLKIHTILALHERRWSIRRIAKELGVHRDTVARHIATHSKAGPPRDPVADVSACTAASAQSAKSGHLEGSAQAFKVGQTPIGSTEANLGQALIGSVASSARSTADATFAAIGRGEFACRFSS